MSQNEQPDLRGPAVILIGSLLGGYHFIGPFATIQEALERWERTLEHRLGKSVVIALLESPAAGLTDTVA